MPKTLLAVDDSATMRKVLEITFRGEDFTVVTADGPQAAMTKFGSGPDGVAVCVIDTVLGSADGYALCRDIRSKDSAVAIVLLASRYAPYDAARGKDSGADDFMDKPFDTQQMIDKVRKVLLAKEGGVPVPVSMGPRPIAPSIPVANIPAAPLGAAVPPIQPRTTQPSLGGQANAARSSTLMFDNVTKPEPLSHSAAATPMAPAKRHDTPPAHTPTAASEPVPMTAAATPAALQAANGHLAAKIGELGLTQAQADAVLALSREVIERVVWEVVPQLAETMIREELARLTK